MAITTKPIHGATDDGPEIAPHGITTKPPASNVAATTDPGVSNDLTQGYLPGSLWINTTGSRVWQCISNASGAAVWQITSLPPAKFSTINVTTGTLAAGNASGAEFTSLMSTNTTPGAQAMRTPAQILTDTPGLAVGQSYVLRVTNTGTNPFTLATDSGAGFTMTGTMTVALNTWRDFVVTINTAVTGTVQQIGTGTSS